MGALNANKLSKTNLSPHSLRYPIYKRAVAMVVNYQLEHKVEYVETASHAISSSKENENAKNARLLESTDTSENRERPNE
jgi:hypothetical protein